MSTNYLDWIIKDKVLRYVPEGEPFICLFSSGKDSMLALSMACDRGGIPVSLVYCESEEDIMNEYVFHWQSVENVKHQAEQLNLPVEYHNGPWYRWPRTAKKFVGAVKYVVFGDLFLESNLNLQLTLCEKLGFIPCMPLWKQPYSYLMDELERYRISSVITVVKPYKLPVSWIGKKFNRETFEQLSKLPIDAFGEYGEFHTLVIDADKFSRPLNHKLGKIHNSYVNITTD